MAARKRFIVVGLGNFGSNVAATLHRNGHEVIAVDVEPETIDRHAQLVTHAAVGDGRDVAILRHLGAAEADTGIVSTGDDVTASVLTTLTLLDIGIDRVIVKVVSDDHARVMLRIGASATIFPEKDSALNLAQMLIDDSIINYLRLGPGFGVQEMKTPPSWIDKTLRDLDLRSRYNISVVGIHHAGADNLSIPPDPTIPLLATDTLIIAGSDQALLVANELEGK